MNLFVFGYGSLMNLDSISRALKRSVTLSELTPAFLSNYQRVWTLKEDVFSEKLNKSITGVFLDLEFRDGTELLNGVLIKVSKIEYNHLRKREKNYDEFDVTDIIQFSEKPLCKGPIKIITFIGKKECKSNSEDHPAYVMKRYLNMLESACDQFSSSFKSDYEKSTETIPFPILAGTYKFINVEQAKYV